VIDTDPDGFGFSIAPAAVKTTGMRQNQISYQIRNSRCQTRKMIAILEIIHQNT